MPPFQQPVGKAVFSARPSSLLLSSHFHSNSGVLQEARPIRSLHPLLIFLVASARCALRFFFFAACALSVRTGFSLFLLYLAPQHLGPFQGSNNSEGNGVQHLGTWSKLGLSLLLLALAACTPSARAEVTILLEEPYSIDGTLAGTGHTAVYLSNVCADSPTTLRRCNPDELGVVLSRYHHLAGYDWIAIPVIPYLYAVEKPEDIPLFVDPKLAWFLRNRYRSLYLESIVPDPPSAHPDTSDWYQLIGSAYDRTLYGFQLPTSPEDDDRLIANFNSHPNHEAYKLVSNNCADFVHDVVTMYYPDSVWRSKLGDLGVMTPKQAAKSLTKFGKRHPELQLTRFFIPQVPGTIKRSRPVHGLMDGFVHAKKYFIPLAVFQPFVAGGAAATYFLGGRFDPAKDASLWTPKGLLERPLTKEERRAWQQQLDALVKSDPSLKPALTRAAWQSLQSASEFHVDSAGHAVLQLNSPAGTANLGATRGNILNSANAQDHARLLLVARLNEELRGGRTKKASSGLIRADFSLLQQSLSANSTNSPTLSASSGSN